MFSRFTNSVYVTFNTIMSYTDRCKAVDILQTDIVIDTNYHMHGKICRDSVSVVCKKKVNACPHGKFVYSALWCVLLLDWSSTHSRVS